MDDGWYDNGDVERSETVMSYHLGSGRFYYDAIKTLIMKVGEGDKAVTLSLDLILYNI
jgi:hypothetical protein